MNWNGMYQDGLGWNGFDYNGSGGTDYKGMARIGVDSGGLD